jgi:hypothetical protein
MIIFDAQHTTGYELANCINYDDLKILIDFDGTSRKEGWKPPRMYRARANRRSGNKLADLPFHGDELIMRRSAVDALRDVLEKHGEILPLATEDGVELWVFNVMVVIDALDKQRSILESIGESGVMMLRNPVFIESSIGDAETFMLATEPNRVYYTERFVARVKAAKLKGTDFVKVWSSDDAI